MRKIHTLVRYLGISDGNMQEGSFRCDANVSVRPEGEAKLGTRAELKNLNSFRFVERAIEIEVERQIDMLEDGGQVVQETRLYDASKNETRSMRSKEEANDYRYFPDPDLLPVIIDDSLIEELRADLPELPDAKRARFEKDYELSAYDAGVLTANLETAQYFEEAVSSATIAPPKLIANWVQGELAAALNQHGLEITESNVSSAELALLDDRIEDGTLSGKMAKDVFVAIWQREGAVDDIIEQRGLQQISDSGAIEKLVDDVLAENPTQVQQFRDGNEKVIGFFVGQIMKASGGKANPKQVNGVLRKKLNE
jgi:aspartyl-tRNA(Asn)/glutamyl-tRNA(Gln) amidotransferase subunit B